MINSKIEWTHHTVNLWHGCQKVHAGCDNCYAEAQSKRWQNDLWGPDKPRKEIKSAFLLLDYLQKQASKSGKKDRVFVGSMMDIFEKPKPLVDPKGIKKDYTHDDGKIVQMTTAHLSMLLFKRISDGMYDNLVFLFLTKRPSNIKLLVPTEWLSEPPANVAFGVSVSDNATAADLIPQLIKNPGNLFVSLEPQLGPCIFNPDWLRPKNDADLNYVSWVIQGGESGPKKRPFYLYWAQTMRFQCELGNCAYFFKQIDKVDKIAPEDFCQEYPTWIN
jgi:protein gp37